MTGRRSQTTVCRRGAQTLHGAFPVLDKCADRSFLTTGAPAPTCEATGIKSIGYGGAAERRAGLATSAALAGADRAAIMRQTRHKSVDVARGYVRGADVWRDNVTARVL
jgi:hypothetical protein